MQTPPRLPRCTDPDFPIDISHQGACQFWTNRLRGQTLIPTQQHPSCGIAIVVPVRNERFSRLERQIRSLQEQEGILEEEYEILYVINNGRPDTDDPTAIANNQLLIRQLAEVKAPNLFVIDSSSPGREIPECNVGRARNRGIAEASLRFFRSGRNGILLQTDADSYFEDPSYLFRLKQAMTEESDVVGIAGGMVFEFSPDTDDPEAVAAMKERLALLELVQRWEYLEHWLHRILSGQGHDLTLHFSGANMISRSLETACIGGLPDLPAGEDPAFGEALMNYAREHRRRILDGRDDWMVVTAARESFRTPSSFGRAFANLDPKHPPSGTDLEALVRIILRGKSEAVRKIPMTWSHFRLTESAVKDLPNSSAMLQRLNSMTRKLGPDSRPPALALPYLHIQRS